MAIFMPIMFLLTILNNVNVAEVKTEVNNVVNAGESGSVKVETKITNKVNDNTYEFESSSPGKYKLEIKAVEGQEPEVNIESEVVDGVEKKIEEEKERVLGEVEERKKEIEAKPEEIKKESEKMFSRIGESISKTVNGFFDFVKRIFGLTN